MINYKKEKYHCGLCDKMKFLKYGVPCEAGYVAVCSYKCVRKYFKENWKELSWELEL